MKKILIVGSHGHGRSSAIELLIKRLKEESVRVVDNADKVNTKETEIALPSIRINSQFRSMRDNEKFYDKFYKNNKHLR